MTTKHTPGPWYTASTGNHQGLVISEATAANVAVAYDKKDAALIAAAPELLTFAENVRAALTENGTAANLGNIIIAAELVIAKAEGRA